MGARAFSCCAVLLQVYISVNSHVLITLYLAATNQGRMGRGRKSEVPDFCLSASRTFGNITLCPQRWARKMLLLQFEENPWSLGQCSYLMLLECVSPSEMLRGQFCSTWEIKFIPWGHSQIKNLINFLTNFSGSYFGPIWEISEETAQLFPKCMQLGIPWTLSTAVK